MVVVVVVVMPRKEGGEPWGRRRRRRRREEGWGAQMETRGHPPHETVTVTVRQPGRTVPDQIP